MPETYRSPHAGTIADLIRQRGQIDARAAASTGDAAAQARMVSGNAWGNAINNIGQTVSGSLRDYANYREDAPNRQLREAQAKRLTAELSAMDTAQAQQQIGKLAEMVKASGYDPSTAEPLFRAIGELSPEYAQPLMRSLMEPALLKNVTDTLITQTPGYKAPEPQKTREVKTRNADGTETIQIVADTPDQSFTSQPAPEENAVVGGRLVGKNTGKVVYEPPPEPEKPTNPTEASLAMMAAQGNKQAANALARLQSMRHTPAEKNPIAVIGDDGQPVYMLPNQAVGRRPASNREQGRPVTSGDAGRIADLDTSLDDLGELEKTLQETSDATGVGAQIGASLPNPVTNLTGWGTDAKKRQGVIDRVKQVIGKALEGGVLRKEDEIKYAKILPTIGDSPEVAASKLTGLRDALIQRRQTTLDALGDAGYDVSKFSDRTSGVDAKVDALIKKYGGGE